jgi:hypothetical protein
LLQAEEGGGVQQSAEAREAMLQFYDRLSASDVASFDQLVSWDPATLAIGTAPGEWVIERAACDSASGPRGSGSRQESRPATRRLAGWVVDLPTFFFPDGSAMKARLTAVLRGRTELGDWCTCTSRWESRRRGGRAPEAVVERLVAGRRRVGSG